MTKAQAGRLGGCATYAKHGRMHMQQIGKRGAAVTWERYTLLPYRQAQYAMVNKQTRQIVAIIGG